MNVNISLAACLLALLVGCGPENLSSVVPQVEKPEGALAPSADVAQLDVARLVPPVSGMPEWTIAEELARYSPDTLFEYVNGAAPQYLSYGFEKLAHIRYAYRGDDLSSVTLDIYDMGSQLGAYGIYSAGRPREISPQEWGAEGYRSGTVAMAYKSHVYVCASADDERPALVAMLESLMSQVTSSIPGDNSKPAILSVLPPRGLIPHSDRYIGKDLLGHSFLPGGFLASYEFEEREGLLFFSDLESPSAADEALGRLRTYEEEHGKVSDGSGLIGAGILWAEDPGLGLGAVTRVGRYVAGIWGVPSRPVAEEILGNLVANLEQWSSKPSGNRLSE